MSISTSAYSASNNSTEDVQTNSVIAINSPIYRSSSDYQESAITLSAINLNRPHILSINTSGSQLQGKVTFNGRVIHQIRGRKAYVNLSPYLSVGKHRVTIAARYAPVLSSVNVEFKGPGIDVSQETSGSGVLQYTLNVNVY